METRFSIVIASYNYGKFIEQALLSVINQDYINYEIIVIDGGSTDNTIDIIKKYENKIAYWVSEKDNGQSDAFNKGFKVAKGEFFFWLNADDVLMPESLKNISLKIDKYPQFKWFVGNTVFFDLNNKILRSRRGPDWKDFLIKNGSIYVYGPSSIFHRNLFLESSGFDLSLNYTMDTDLWMRFANLGYKFKRVNSYIWGLRIHEESKTAHAFTAEPNPKFFAEQRHIEIKNKWLIKKNKVLLQTLYKMISGLYLKSFIDSIKLKNKTI